MIAEDDFPAARCMAACQLARIDPVEGLIETLLPFISGPIEGYENIPGAGGKSTGDAAFSISHLPPDIRRRAVPAICDRLDQARCFRHDAPRQGVSSPRRSARAANPSPN